MKDKPIDRPQLFNFFAGRSTILEQAEIDKWIREGDNFELFFDALHEWETLNPQYNPSLESGYQKFQKMARGHGYLPVDKSDNKRKYLNQFRIWITVASILALLITGYFLQEKVWYRTVKTGFAETKTVSLSDSSQIVLNANSSVRIPRLISWHMEREVWLQGEAFFTVTRTYNQRKFVVHTQHLDVEVLGTKFNVNSRRQKTRVVLQDGSVRVSSPRDSQKTLAMLQESGDFVESDGAYNDLVVGHVDHSLYTAWQDRKLIFENVLVTEVVQSINEFYGVTIHCKDSSILERSFSGTLPNDNLDIVLRSLSNIYETQFYPEHPAMVQEQNSDN